MTPYKTEFQTPADICKYMADMIPTGAKSILEPTKGIGNLVNAIREKGNYDITAPDNYFELDKKRTFDCIVMNPPFSSKYACDIPSQLQNLKGMRLGYHILQECMGMSNHVIALMPLYTISNSDKRLRFIKDYGMRSVTMLPRKTFPNMRAQTVILELERGYKGETIFKIIKKNS